MKHRCEDEKFLGGTGEFGFDPSVVLLKDPSLLLDPSFLGALHTELRDQLGDQGADVTLLQMGFVHGMQDALEAVDRAFNQPRNESAPVLAPPLAIQMRRDPAGGAKSPFELCGAWPDRIEASARVTALGRPANPSCFLSAGYTSGWLSGTLDANILALESSCSACGAQVCSFTALEDSAWLEREDAEAVELLSALPFDAIRSYVNTQRSTSPPIEMESEFIDQGSTVVQIWGPVMVVPFTGPDEAMQAVNLVGHDPAARDVSVVIIDLSGAIVDDHFDALALEQIVEVAESWGAETIFAEVSPLSAPVVEGLERQPLVVHKDLSQAIVAAFQIAEAQRTTA